MFFPRTIVVAAVASFTFVLAHLSAQATTVQPIEVKIIAINDFHGYILPPPDFVLPLADPKTGKTSPFKVGGAASLSTLVKQLKAKNPNSIFVASGDLIGGSPAISAFTLDEATIDILNQMGLEVSAVGNHEFDRGLAALKRLQDGGCAPISQIKSDQVRTCVKGGVFEGARFPYLGGNVIDEVTKKVLFPATFIRDFGAVKIGFIGVTLKETASTTAGAQGLDFLQESLIVNLEARKLKEQGVGAVIVLLHQGGGTSAKLINDKACPGLEGPIKKVVSEFNKDVDVVISAHTHREYICTINGILTTQAGFYGNLVTEIDLKIEPGKSVISKTATNIPVLNEQNKVPVPGPYAVLPADPEVVKLVEFYDRASREGRMKQIGFLAEDLKRVDTEKGARINIADHPIGRVLTDAYAAVPPPQGKTIDFAILHPGGIRGSLSRSADGSVNYDQLFSIVPFGQDLVYLELTGAQLQKLMQEQWAAANCTTRQYKGICGRILQFSNGVRLQWETVRASGQPATGGRVVRGSFKINGQPINPKKVYGIVTVDYLGNQGGDNFKMFKSAKNLQSLKTTDLDALIAYLSRFPQNAPLAVPPPRITCKNCKVAL